MTMELSQRRRRATSLYTVALLVAALVLLSVNQAAAWSTNPNAFQRRKQSPMNKSAQKPSLTSQNMLRNPSSPRVREQPQKSTSKLSNSVLASCDTLPRFPTAHGLLSPETVMRLEEFTAGGHGSDALVNFLNLYHRKGPLSCLPLLSDPDVLPHLTRAMRDIAE